MKKIIILTLLAGSTMISCGQERQCNRMTYVTSFANRLPSDICLPEGYFLADILSDTVDIDGDGRIDFAARLQKIDAQDGDTTLVVLYKQNEKGNYEEWTTFNNLFPIFLKDYSYDYYRDHKDRSFFMELRHRYVYANSSEVFFEQKTIVIKFNTGGGGGLLLHFTFDNAIDTWKLTKQMEWFGTWGKIERIPDWGIVIPKNQYSIKDFNMLDYLDEVLYED